jgi:hypothetical protein
MGVVAPSKLEAGATLHDFTTEVDIDADARPHLPEIERFAFAVSVISGEYMAKVAQYRSISEERDKVPSTDSPRYGVIEPSDKFPDFVLAFPGIKIIGYDKTSILPASYASLHELTTAGLWRLKDVTCLLDDESSLHWKRIGTQW